MPDTFPRDTEGLPWGVEVVQDDVPILNPALQLKFAGAGVLVTDTGNRIAQVTIAGATVGVTGATGAAGPSGATGAQGATGAAAGVAAFVDPLTATAGQIATALINAGLMAAS